VTIRRRTPGARVVTSSPSSLLRSAQQSSSSENFNSGNGNPSSPSRAAAAVAAQRRRLQVAGVSVSSRGFYVILQANASHYLPLRVTDDAMDESAATSPQALTILQLLARVDMAGAILPPDTLAKIVVLTLEEEIDQQQQQEDFDEKELRNSPSTLASNTPVGSAVLELVQERLNKLDYTNATTYSELLEYPWLQSRVSLPTVTLDELFLSLQRSESGSSSASTVKSFTLVCSVKNLKVGSALSVELTESVCESVSYEYRPNGVSLAFVAVALALRYRSPIELALTEGLDREGAELSTFKLLTLDEILEEFPLYRSAAQLQQTTERVTSNIEKGLKVNQLQAALRIALQKEDFAAATKIRRALDEMDSMSDLPTQAESDTDSMQ
jgi:hypothetical protein